MKFVCIAIVATFAVITAAQRPRNLENVNVDMILKNDRILSSYVKCVLDKGPCTNEGRELKTSIPQVLRTGCDNCSENERRASRKVILHLQQKKPNEWKQIEKKYDPSGDYARKYRKLFEN